MHRVIQLWFNGKRDYFTGLALLHKAGGDADLVNTLRMGITPYNTQRLHNCLQELMDEMAPDDLPKKIIVKKATPVIELPPADAKAENAPLYDVTIAEAHNAYKEAMNLRSELFALCRVEGWEDPNMPNQVQIRSKLAVDVVVKYNYASKLYDKADHVRKTGRLPNDEVPNEAVEDYTDLPPAMVKQTLDNLRKNFNKIKKRPVTAERTALMQKHEANIKILEEKWHLLKSTL